MPSIARQFKDLNPEVEFSLLAVPTAHQLQALQTGSLDIGFLRLPIGKQSALEVLTVHREPFVLVVPSSHKLAKRKRVRLGVRSKRQWLPPSLLIEKRLGSTSNTLRRSLLRGVSDQG